MLVFVFFPESQNKNFCFSLQWTIKRSFDEDFKGFWFFFYFLLNFEEHEVCFLPLPSPPPSVPSLLFDILSLSPTPLPSSVYSPLQSHSLDILPPPHPHLSSFSKMLCPCFAPTMQKNCKPASTVQWVALLPRDWEAWVRFPAPTVYSKPAKSSPL